VLSPRTFATLLAALLLAGCGGSAHPRAIPNIGMTAAPPTLLLYSETRIATLHFPAGTYTLSSADRIGYYYSAPRGIIQHTAAASVAQRGGIFVSKRDRTKLRGYIYLAGGVVHVGNLSRARHAFR
jgi:hypothetical protein